MFLDISEAFDKVWHKGLIFKLKQNGISGNLLSTLTDFLNFTKQRVALDGLVLYQAHHKGLSLALCYFLSKKIIF